MLFSIDHGNSAMKTVNFVFPSGLIDNPIRPPVDTEMLGVRRQVLDAIRPADFLHA